MKQKETILTLEEVSAKLRICRTTAALLLTAGTLPGVKVGRQWRVSDAAIDTYIRGSHGQSRGTNKTRPAT